MWKTFKSSAKPSQSIAHNAITILAGLALAVSAACISEAPTQPPTNTPASPQPASSITAEINAITPGSPEHEAFCRSPTREVYFGRTIGEPYRGTGQLNNIKVYLLEDGYVFYSSPDIGIVVRLNPLERLNIPLCGSTRTVLRYMTGSGLIEGNQ